MKTEDEEMCVDWNVAWLRNERRTASLQWDYDKKLVHITVKMRSVLLDWLFEVAFCVTIFAKMFF